MNDTRDAVIAAANKWMQAWVARDAAVLDEMLAPDFALIASATPVMRLERAVWLKTACTRYTASYFRYRDVQVRELGPGFCIMSSIAEFEAEIDGVARKGPLFIVDVWRQDGERWQVCARFSSNPEPGSLSAVAVTALR